MKIPMVRMPRVPDADGDDNARDADDDADAGADVE